MSLYFAFKHGSFIHDVSGGCIPEILGEQTLIHTEIVIQVNCTGTTGCSYCKESQRLSRDGKPHYLAFWNKRGELWRYEVDNRKFMMFPHLWTYVCIPIGDTRRALDYLLAQVGKPLNESGYWCNFLFGREYGVGSFEGINTQQIKTEKDSWLCTELSGAVLVDQSYKQCFQGLKLCQMWPIEFWFTITQRIPNATIPMGHPSVAYMSRPACNYEWPPGGVFKKK